MLLVIFQKGTALATRQATAKYLNDRAGNWNISKGPTKLNLFLFVGQAEFFFSYPSFSLLWIHLFYCLSFLLSPFLAVSLLSLCYPHALFLHPPPPPFCFAFLTLFFPYYLVLTICSVHCNKIIAMTHHLQAMTRYVLLLVSNKHSCKGDGCNAAADEDVLTWLPLNTHFRHMLIP